MSEYDVTIEQRILESIDSVSEELAEFRVDMADRLGRIETRGELQGNALTSLEDRVLEVEVDTKVVQKVAGRRGGAFGAAVGVVVGGIFEGLRQWFQ